ncbi:MAG: hypothetical protein M0D57_13650 [Sphingobacteriales bacterium JAD_PAG50586_3]|nr:MAG: hypothetical protein M0D57_13650 [Sphingobacteriales bacterium JAD_PAG50586_3]
MKIIAIAAAMFFTINMQAQVIDTIGPKSNPNVTRGPRSQNTDPVVKPTYTDTIKRQPPQGTNPQPNWSAPKDISQPQPNNNSTQPSVPPTQTNPTSPATPTIPQDRRNGVPPGK